MDASSMISNMIKEGKIVPSEVTVELLQKAMLESGNNKFLIDGFPRNEENRATFENVTKIEPEFILFFNCPEEEMEQRLLSRNQVIICFLNLLFVQKLICEPLIFLYDSGER
ncbi:hypothetical protein GW17_00035166 [Ensete ventricosum]|nr:hypothetical protein GW17_00035166 [Ensete ventricosum]